LSPWNLSSVIRIGPLGNPLESNCLNGSPLRFGESYL
jgi:hypothetical protein